MGRVFPDTTEVGDCLPPSQVFCPLTGVVLEIDRLLLSECPLKGSRCQRTGRQTEGLPEAPRILTVLKWCQHASHILGTGWS